MSQEILLPSRFAEMFLQLQGNAPFEFRPPGIMRTIYDTHRNKVLLKTGRQVAKSTTIANKMVYWACMIDGFRNLYVSASETQTKQFSQDRLSSALKSPKIKEIFFQEKNQANNMFFKQLSNSSNFRLHHCYVSADRIRGPASDGVCIDEIQDIDTNEIPVILETQFTSPYKYKIFCGTPKTEDSAIEFYWNLSTRTELEIFCTHCNRFNYIDEKNIGRKGLICRYDKCRKPISGMNGKWVHYNPDGEWLAFRLPQISLPWADWKEEIWDKYHSYSQQKFYNEKLALPYDVGVKPVTREQIMACCDDDYKIDYEDTIKYLKRTRDYALMTLDWGGGESAFSVMTIMANIRGRLRVLYAKKYKGEEANPEFIKKHILKTVLATEGGIQLVAADFGYGFGQNDWLNEHLADHCHFFPIQSSGQNLEWVYDKAAYRFKVDRTLMLSSVFGAIRDRKIRFPRWQDFEPFANDIMAEYIDYRSSGMNRGRMFYNHAMQNPDDFLQTIAMGYLMARIQMDHDFHHM